MTSERDFHQIELLVQIDDGRLTVENGAKILCLTLRQVLRLLKRNRPDDAESIRHKARGKSPNNYIHKAKPS